MHAALPMPADSTRLGAARARITELHPDLSAGTWEDLARQLVLNPSFADAAGDGR